MNKLCPLIFTLGLLPFLANAEKLYTGNTGANQEDPLACHSDSVKITLITILLKPVLSEYGDEIAKDLFEKLQPDFDLILITGRNPETQALSCSARLIVSTASLNTKNVSAGQESAAFNSTLLTAAGHRVEQDSFIKPSGFGDGIAYWEGLNYTIQPTSDGRDHVVMLEDRDGYAGWLKVIVKYGGLEVTDEEAQLAADREAGREQAEREAAAESQTPAPSTNSTPPKPSFDCSKASSANEKLICSDPELSSLDAELGTIYQQAKGKAADPAAFKKSTVEAWKWREAHCQNKQCLVDWYAQRKQWLLSRFQ